MVTIWKNATGVGRGMDSERIIRFGLPGSADIIGIVNGGKFLAIECKTGNAKQSTQQVAFQKMIEHHGGIYILARCIEDVAERLEIALA